MCGQNVSGSKYRGYVSFGGQNKGRLLCAEGRALGVYLSTDQFVRGRIINAPRSTSMRRLLHIRSDPNSLCRLIPDPQSLCRLVPDPQSSCRLVPDPHSYTAWFWIRIPYAACFRIRIPYAAWFRIRIPYAAWFRIRISFASLVPDPQSACISESRPSGLIHVKAARILEISGNVM